jgi:AraC-like DNA-binding protein
MGEREVPLASFPGLLTEDLDEARDWVGRALRPHRLTVVGEPSLHVVHNMAELGATGFHFIDYGTDVKVEVEALDFVLVQIPTAGRALIRAGDREVVATSKVAAVANPTDALSMEYFAPNPRLMVRIDRTALESRLRLMLGSTPTRAVQFDLAMDLTASPGRSWRALVDVVLADLESGGAIAASPLAAKSLESTIIDGLLAVQRNTYSEQLEQPGERARPRTIQRAVTLLQDHCTEPLTTADIAEAVGVSARSLQEGFHAHVGTTPMAYLRRVRLHQVNEELRAADPATTNVTDVALRWGMTHLGRFAQAYREEFGEAPSATLRFGS